LGIRQSGGKPHALHTLRDMHRAQAKGPSERCPHRACPFVMNTERCWADEQHELWKKAAQETRVTKDMNAKQITEMDPFLPPIEKPTGLIMKLAYYFSQKQFGKVLTPLKVHSARLPAAFGLFYGKIGSLDKKLVLRRETVMLIREQVARINVCLFCMDIGRAFTIKESMSQAKFEALEQYRTSELFTEAERAVLDYATELTKNKHVKPETFECLSRHYSEREICEIVWLVASEHVYNMTNIGLNIHSDLLCDINRKRKAA
jgi:alkylhydroperoxidase family enzyme